MKNNNGTVKIIQESKTFFDKRINKPYFNIFREIPLLLQVSAQYSAKSKPVDYPRSILIINTSLLGDFIVSLPAINYFIKEHDSAAIDMMVAPVVYSLSTRIKGLRNVFISRTIFSDKNEDEVDFSDMPEKYDYVLIVRIPPNIIQLLNYLEFEQLRTYLGPYLKLGLKMLSGKNSVVQLTRVNFEVINEEDIDSGNIDAARFFQFDNDELKNIEDHQILKNLENQKKIVIHTGSGWEVKFWELSNWVELLERINSLGNNSFIFTGASEREEYDFQKLSELLSFPIYSIIKKFDVKDTLLFMRQCDFFIGIDSGPRHIAHLLDLPSISLLGPGPKSFAPLNNNGIVIDKATHGCTNLACFYPKTCMEKI
ncbi:MAG: heptosyltransferase, partial [Bacteroidota bacterium]|nr:heptosyltransferase [Bacteroidota bacterium]